MGSAAAGLCCDTGLAMRLCDRAFRQTRETTARCRTTPRRVSRLCPRPVTGAVRRATYVGSADADDVRFKLPGLSPAAKARAGMLALLLSSRLTCRGCIAGAGKAGVRHVQRHRAETLRTVRGRWGEPGGPFWRTLSRRGPVLALRGTPITTRRYPRVSLTQCNCARVQRARCVALVPT